MRTLTAKQKAIVASNTKTDISWLFEIDRTGNGSVDDYWSTKAKTWNAQNYTFKVIDFSPIKMERNKSEFDILAPSSFSFTLTNKNGTLTPADFAGGNTNIRLIVKAWTRKITVTVATGTIPAAGETMTGDTSGAVATLLCSPDSWSGSVACYFSEQTGTFEEEDVTFSGGATGTIAEDITWEEDEDEILLWNFDFVGISPQYQTLRFECRDWLTKYLDGVYPNTSLIHHLWPTNEQGDYKTCIPIVFGTVYIPITSAYITDGRYYILGIDTPTYTITAARSPIGAGNVLEWLPATTTFTQSTKTGNDSVDYKVLEVIAMDSNGDSIADTNWFFQIGGSYYPLSILFSRNDLVSYTSPLDVIDYILQDFGIPSGRIDSTTKAAVKAIHASRGLTWAVGLYEQENRKTLLARLCQNCGVELILRDKIYFKDHSPTSQDTITIGLIIEKSFTYSWSHETGLQDCANVLYPHISGGLPSTQLVKALIPVKATTNVKSGITISCPYVTSGSVHSQKLGIMAIQRNLLSDAIISFSGKGKLLALEPDDMISISGTNYGGNYDCLIDSMTINKNLTINFSLTKFSDTLDAWEGLSPDAVVIGEDNTSNSNTNIISAADAIIHVRGHSEGLAVTIKDFDELYVSGGSIDINGTIYNVESQLTVSTGTIVVDTIYYIYVAQGATTVLTASDFSLSTTAPTYDHGKAGWYKTGDGTKRLLSKLYRISNPDLTDVTPAVSGDDGYWHASGFFDNSGTDIRIRKTAGSDYARAFVRFPNIPIANSATIQSAIITFTAASSDSSSTINSNCYFNAADNPSAPGNQAACEALSLTTAVAWNNIAAWTINNPYDTPELKTALQEVINRAGWVSGNALLFVWKINTNSSLSTGRYAKSFDAGTGLPSLTVIVDDISFMTVSDRFLFDYISKDSGNELNDGEILVWDDSRKAFKGTDTPTVDNITINSLTASKPVFTDENKKLVSTGTLAVDQGGTGAATLTDHGVLLGSGTGAITPTAVGATGSLLQGQTGADPVFSAMSTLSVSRTFFVNGFHFPAPATEWVPTIYGAYLPASLSAKKCWIPLNFLKAGDIITAYNLVGDATETTALTLDCKLVQVNKADPLTTTDITSGAITQITAGGNFDSAVNPTDTTVATDKQYLLEITGTTDAGDEIYVIGAEITITRLI